MYEPGGGAGGVGFACKLMKFHRFRLTGPAFASFSSLCGPPSGTCWHVGVIHFGKNWLPIVLSGTPQDTCLRL